MTAQGWCSRAVRVGFSAALASMLAAASSATAATVMILTEHVVRWLSRADDQAVALESL